MLSLSLAHQMAGIALQLLCSVLASYLCSKQSAWINGDQSCPIYTCSTKTSVLIGCPNLLFASNWEATNCMSYFDWLLVLDSILSILFCLLDEKCFP